MNINKTQKVVDHPLESIFDIEAGTTVVEYNEVVPAEVIQSPNYDAKDIEIEGQIEDVYAIALTAVTAISDEMERVEGRHKARMGEVMATNLGVALDAIKLKSSIKAAKDRNHVAVATGPAQHITNNLNITADRNQILRALAEGRKG